MKKYLSIIALAALLSACGGSGGGSDGGSSGGTSSGSTGGSVADTFTNAIAVLVAMMSEDGSPVSTDAYSATAPEDTQPGQVM